MWAWYKFFDIAERKWLNLYKGYSMTTLQIQLIDPKAYRLLQDMEDLNLIRVLKAPIKISSLRGKLKAKMSNEQIDKQMQSIRNEWQSDI